MPDKVRVQLTATRLNSADKYTLTHPRPGSQTPESLELTIADTH